MTRFLLLLLALGALLPCRSQAQAVMRTGDVFDLRLSGMPVEYAAEFATQYTVGDSGEVRIPFIGELKAAGTSSTTLARAIERKLVAEKIFTSPTAVITLNPASRFVTVGGAVRSPQAVPWTNDLTLSNAIIRAGGDNGFPNYRKVKLTRDGKATFYNLSRADKDPAQNPKLLPGDEVILPE
ncbi:MAG TPA: polysaccharide biosynthesis/export family protein [Chthoniobacteraceae bacterium]|jgi:polysaccharide export outer membrane protein|nr:polysaccharide biosynthesis/export family protein [Chthoniobacteraceae bacterium]